MGKTDASASEVIAAIKGTGGIKTTIAKKLGVSRWTVDNYIERWSTVKDAYLEEKAGVDDAAVSVVVADIVNNRSVETAKWWMARKLDEFSDKSKHEVTGAGGEGLIIKVIEGPRDVR